MKKYWFLWEGVFIWITEISAQDQNKSGLQTEMAFTQSLGKGWKINEKILSDLYFHQGTSNRSEGLKKNLRLDQFEYSLTTAKSISSFLNLALW
ncbi:MAG: hypothetical protein WD431_16505 [Cyclobacteriaceae bacterium]